MLRQSGVLAARARPRLQGRRLRRDARRAPTRPGCASRFVLGAALGGVPGARATTSTRRRSRRARRRWTSTSRSTSSTRRARPASRRARRSRTTTSSTTASSSARSLGYTEADRVCIPVPFYHCFGMVLGNLAVVTHGACVVDPVRGVRPARRRSRRSRPSAARRSTACRRCSSPSSPIRRSPSCDLSHAAHRRSWPARRARSRSCAACRARCTCREVTICYGMTETSPVSTQTRRDDPLDAQVGTVGRVHPHVEVKIVDPATGADRRRAASRASCARAATR